MPERFTIASGGARLVGEQHIPNSSTNVCSPFAKPCKLVFAREAQ